MRVLRNGLALLMMSSHRAEPFLLYMPIFMLMETCIGTWVNTHDSYIAAPATLFTNLAYLNRSKVLSTYAVDSR